MLHILMNHLLAKTGSEILPPTTHAKANAVLKGDFVEMLEKASASNDERNMFSDVVTKLESQERSINEADEGLVHGRAVTEDLDVHEIDSDDPLLDAQIDKLFQTEADVADVPTRADPAEIAQSKHYPIDRRPSSASREDETLSAPDLSTIGLASQEGTRVSRETRELGIVERTATSANVTQPAQNGAALETYPDSPEPKSIQSQNPPLAADHTTVRHDRAPQVWEKSLPLHEVTVTHAVPAFVPDAKTGEVHEYVPTRSVLEPEWHQENAQKFMPVSEKLVPIRHEDGRLQNTPKAADSQRPEKAPFQIPASLSTDINLAKTDIPQNKHSYLGSVASVQNYVVSGNAKSELSLSAHAVSRSLQESALQESANPETSRTQQVFLLDRHAPVLAFHPEKPKMPSPPTGSFDQTPFAQLQPKVVQEVAADLLPSFASLGTTETTQVSKQVQSTVFQMPDLPRHVAQQMATAVRSTSGNAVEITLKPVELGRVQISMATSESGVVVYVTAERPETLELMRRHIDQLAAEFQEIGYGQSEFRFNGTGSDESQARYDQEKEQTHGTTDSNLSKAHAHGDDAHLAPTGQIDLDRVDIRI